MGRCSHCDSPDHNKRTCEKYTARLAAMAAGWDPDGLWSRAYAARIKPQKRPRAATLCGYCRASGHTRRTCPSLVEDRKWYTQVHNESVDILHSYLQRSHIGLGSLFKVRLSEWEGSNIRYVDRLYLLISLEMPNNLLTTGLQPHMVLREISSKGHHIRKPLRPFLQKGLDPSSSRKSSLISPRRQDLPNDWVSSRKISFEDSKTHCLFQRSGYKQDDKRNYVFIQMSEHRRALQRGTAPGMGTMQAKRLSDEWSISSRLSSMMVDYKNQTNTNV